MKVCFIGLGSIGKRHLKNLVNITQQFGLDLTVHAYRQTKRQLEDSIKSLINQEIFNQKDLSDDYDIAFITSPTSLHYDHIRLMVKKTKHMFIEKPLFDHINYDMTKLPFKSRGVYYVAGPLKFTTVVQRLRKIIKKEKIYNIRAICSSYLPNWRPGRDYRNIYSAKKAEGGGVSLDLIHEWDYITFLFGFPKKVFNLRGHFSHLEINSDDLSVYIAEYPDKLVEIHLDYFGRVPKRQVEIFTEKGTILADILNKHISFSDHRPSIDLSNNETDMYVEEMNNFILKIINNSEDNNIKHSYKLLKLASGRN